MFFSQPGNGASPVSGSKTHGCLPSLAGCIENGQGNQPRHYHQIGVMLGLGETQDEVIGVMRDLRQAGCDLLTLGQYLAPSPGHHPVVRFVTPEEFAEYEQIGLIKKASRVLRQLRW